MLYLRQARIKQGQNVKLLFNSKDLIACKDKLFTRGGGIKYKLEIIITKYILNATFHYTVHLGKANFSNMIGRLVYCSVRKVSDHN